MNTVFLHQCRIAGRYSFEKAGQVMDVEFCIHFVEDLLKPGIVSGAEVGWHAHANQQYGDSQGIGVANHLTQVVGALIEPKTAQAIVTAKLDDQMARLMLSQQFGQALQATKGSFAADTGIDYACVRKTCPYIGAEQLRPALVYRYFVGGTQTVAYYQDFYFRVFRIARAVNAQQHNRQHEQDHG